MDVEKLKKILFVLEMAKNKLKDDKEFLEYNKEVRQYVLELIMEVK